MVYLLIYGYTEVLLIIQRRSRLNTRVELVGALFYLRQVMTINFWNDKYWYYNRNQLEVGGSG